MVHRAESWPLGNYDCIHGFPIDLLRVRFSLRHLFSRNCLFPAPTETCLTRKDLFPCLWDGNFADFTAIDPGKPFKLADDEAGLVLPYAILHMTPPLVSLLGLAAITSAVMSSVDSSFLSASSLFTQNIYHTLLRPKVCSSYVRKSLAHPYTDSLNDELDLRNTFSALLNSYLSVRNAAVVGWIRDTFFLTKR